MKLQYKAIAMLACMATMVVVLASPSIQRAKMRSVSMRAVAVQEDRGRTGDRSIRIATAGNFSRLHAPPQAADPVPPIVVDGSRARILPLSFRLLGTFEDTGAGTPTVIVRVGDVQVPAVVADNTFSADLAYVPGASMVSIELANADVRYRALLGSAANLKRQSGGDAAVDQTENPSLRISPLSTALHFFITRELGGRLPANDEEMDAALRSILVSDIAPAANMLSKVARGETALPEGFADGYALLLDRQAYRAFLRAGPPQLGDANAYMLGVKGQPFAVSDLQRDWGLIGRMMMNRVSFVQPSVQLMLKTPSGYALHANPSRRNVAFTRQVEANGDLRLVPSGTVSYDTTSIKPYGLNGASVVAVERHAVNSETYRQLFRGKRAHLWLNLSDETLSYPQYPERGTTPFAPLRYQFASALDEIKAPVQAAHVLGRRGFPMFCLQPSLAAGEPASLGNCEFALHFFGANGFGTIENIGKKVDSALNPLSGSGSAAFAWTLESDGGLRVDGSAYSVRLWRLDVSEGPADAMVYLASAQDGPVTLTLAGHTVVVDGNQPVAFSAADPVGTWKYGSFGDERAAYAYDVNLPLQETTFIHYADGTSSMLSFVDPADQETGESLTWNFRAGWKLINSDLYDTRYRANVSISLPNTSNFSSCEAAFAQGATQCAATHVRYFRPLAKVGRRWYGIEDIYSRSITSSYTPPFYFDRFSRANYYELQ